ncbi:Uncharacterized protein FWK35_00005096, partial [Aphis craccivora]
MCDTMASNTGRVFEVKFKLNTIGPDIPIFKKFQQAWPEIDLKKYETGINDVVVKSILTVIFLGENPPNGIFFHYPGAFHHARWMSKAIYSLKIYKRMHFEIYKHGLDQWFSTFFVCRDTPVENHWFRCPAAINASYNDFIFFFKFIEYPDKAISNTATHKFCGHLWYLAPESIAISFFDFRVPTEIKIKMVKALKSTQNNDDTINKIVLSKEDIKTLIKKKLHEFVSPEIVNFFSRFKISTDFIGFHPDSWKDREDYKKGINILTELSVINDVAERVVKLIQEYNIVNDYNKKNYSDLKKNTLI